MVEAGEGFDADGLGDAVMACVVSNKGRAIMHSFSGSDSGCCRIHSRWMKAFFAALLHPPAGLRRVRRERCIHPAAGY